MKGSIKYYKWVAATCLVIGLAGCGYQQVKPSDAHMVHADHSHQHKNACGHEVVAHADHQDYLHDGHYHSMHANHMDDHGTI